MSIDGIACNRNGVTKVAFSFSGFPSYFRAKPENWFLLGLSTGHDVSMETLHEIANAVRQMLEPLQKVKLPFDLNGKTYASIRLLNVIADSPVATRVAGSIAPVNQRPCWRCFAKKEDCWKASDENDISFLGKKGSARSRVLAGISDRDDATDLEKKFGLRVDRPNFPVDDIEMAVQPCLLHVEDQNNIRKQLKTIVDSLSDKELQKLDSLLRGIQVENRSQHNSRLPSLRYLRSQYRGSDCRYLIQLLPAALLGLAKTLSPGRRRVL